MFKTNDSVIANTTVKGIVKGREYKVTKAIGAFVYVVDDRGREAAYLPKRFDMKPSVKPQPELPVIKKVDLPLAAWPFPKGDKPAKPKQTPEGQLPPQLRTILRHLKTAGSITLREALADYSIQSLTRRVTELIAHGYPIRKERKVHPTTGQRYTRYALA